MSLILKYKFNRYEQKRIEKEGERELRVQKIDLFRTNQTSIIQNVMFL